MIDRSSTISSGLALACAIGLSVPGSAMGSAAPTTVSSAAVPAAKVDWPQYHGQPNHRGLNRKEHVVGAATVHNLSLSWIGNGSRVGEDLVYRSCSTVVDGYVYFGTEGGQLLAFRDDCASSECEPAWRLSLVEAILNTPAVVDGVIFFGTASSEGWFYAFDVDACASTGGACDPLWKAKMAVGSSSPTVSHGVVYVGSQSRGVYAFDTDGCGQTICLPLWVGSTTGYVLNSPAVANGHVYAGDADGKLYAFDAAGCGDPSCEAEWIGPVSGPIYDASPVVVRGQVYVPSFADTNSYLNVFDADGCGADECEPLWLGTGGHYLNSAPAVAYGRVYLGSGDGTLRVYPARGCGNPRCPAVWFGDTAGPVATSESPPMVANGVVYIGENNGRVYAYKARGCGSSMCEAEWQFLTQDPLVNSSPTMVNGTLYVSGTNFGAVPILYVFERALT